MSNLEKLKREYETKNYNDGYPGLSYEGIFKIFN